MPVGLSTPNPANQQQGGSAADLGSLPVDVWLLVFRQLDPPYVDPRSSAQRALEALYGNDDSLGPQSGAGEALRSVWALTATCRSLRALGKELQVTAWRRTAVAAALDKLRRGIFTCGLWVRAIRNGHVRGWWENWVESCPMRRAHRFYGLEDEDDEEEEEEKRLDDDLVAACEVLGIAVLHKAISWKGRPLAAFLGPTRCRLMVTAEDRGARDRARALASYEQTVLVDDDPPVDTWAWTAREALEQAVEVVRGSRLPGSTPVPPQLGPFASAKFERWGAETAPQALAQWVRDHEWELGPPMVEALLGELSGPLQGEGALWRSVRPYDDDDGSGDDGSDDGGSEDGGEGDGPGDNGQGSAAPAASARTLRWMKRQGRAV